MQSMAAYEPLSAVDLEDARGYDADADFKSGRYAHALDHIAGGRSSRVRLAAGLAVLLALCLTFFSLGHPAIALTGSVASHADVCSPMGGSRPFRFHVYQDMPHNLLGSLYDEYDLQNFTDLSNEMSQHSLERILWKLLPQHPCHTNDLSLAEAFFVPAQTATAVVLANVKGLRPDLRNYRDLVMDWVETVHAATWNATHGADHWFTREAFGFMDRRYGDRANLIGIELVDSFDHSGSKLDDREDWYNFIRGTHDIVGPYPDPTALATFTPEFLAQHPKDTTIVFAGTSRNPGRRKMRDYLEKLGQPRGLWTEMSDPDRLAADEIYATLARGEFSIVTAGDSYSSRRVFTMMTAGTIPVIIVDHIILPFNSVIDWSELAVFVPEAKAFDDPTFDLYQHLQAIPESRRERMRAAARRVRHSLTYHDDRIVPGDATDMIVAEMALSTIKSRDVMDTLRRMTSAEHAR